MRKIGWASTVVSISTKALILRDFGSVHTGEIVSKDAQSRASCFCGTGKRKRPAGHALAFFEGILRLFSF